MIIVGTPAEIWVRKNNSEIILKSANATPKPENTKPEMSANLAGALLVEIKPFTA